MHLFLHVGTEKTGTTSIQEFLKLNQRHLRRQGVFLPESLEHGSTGNHRRLVALVADEDTTDDFYAEVNIIALDKRRERTSAWRSAFDLELSRATDCSAAIITSEHLHSRLRQRHEIERLSGFIKERFKTVSIIIYLRDPLEATVASVSTVVKAGGRLIDIPDPFHSGWRFLVDHRNTLQSWGDVFGREKLIPRLFIPEEFRDGSLIHDFAGVCGLDTVDLEMPLKTNESLSFTGMQLLSQLNQRLPRLLPGGGLNPERGGLTEIFSKCFTTGPRQQAPQELAASYRAAFAESNEWVRKNFFPYRDRLFPDTNSDVISSPRLLDADLVDLAVLIEELWKNQRGP